MRIKAVFRPGDYEGADQAGLTALFDHVAPGATDPLIDRDHAGIAIAARNPAMALQMARLSKLLALDTSWAARPALREIALATVNRHFGADYALAARERHAIAAGLSPIQLAAIGGTAQAALFDAEQRLVIAYARAVVSGPVPAPLFALVVEAFGETEAVELTTIIGVWSCWAMLLNAAGAGGD